MTADDVAPGDSTADPWRSVFDASLVPSAITRRHDGEILFVNRAILSLLGWTEADVVGRTMTDVGFWMTREQRASMLDQLGRTGVVRDLEQTLTTHSGDTIVVLTSIAPVVLDGAPCLLGHVQDVTQSRRLEDALRESEERFRLLAENSTDVIARSSADWTIRYMSPACRAMYGYEPEQMVGRSGWDFVHPEDRARLRGELSANVSDAGDVVSSYRVVHRDGSHVWVEAKTVTLTGPDGEVVAFHTTARDITERMEAEAVISRTREDAVRANLAKNEFLSRMSHELRTPLHAILGFGDLLAQEDLKPAVREGLEQITKSGRHLLELINEVLDISSIERGDLRMSLEPVHVGLLISEALEMVAPLASAASIDLPMPGEDEVDHHVLADRHRLKQAVLNLLSNALKYTRPGGEVRVRVDADGSDRVRIEVADTGIGIAHENLSRVFAAFDRLGAETTDVEGTGLGLTLSKRLIEAMGGTIGVESEVGRGTTFRIALPAAEPPQARAGATPAPPAGERARPQPAGRCVLYIEDNPSNIKLAEAILARRPEVTLLVATQGGLGLELAREHQPAVILLDLNLPDISGEEVLRRIRSDPRTATINVVVLSADATPGQVDRMRRAGANDYLTKPFEIVEFLAVIDAESATAPAVADPALRGGADDDGATGPLRQERMTKLRRLYAEEGALREFVELFVADVAARIDVLEAAVRAGDAAAVWQSAHAMRGSCSLAGAHRVEAELAQIEAITRREELPGADAIAALRSAFAEAERALFGELE